MPAKYAKSMISLFDDTKPSADSLFVVHNERVEKMTVAEIFDAKIYTDFKAVSYVSSPKFFSDTVKDFKSVTFILGIDNSENLTKFSDGISAQFNVEERLTFFNELSDEAKNSISENNLQIRYGNKGIMIHDKIYLLSDVSTGNYRVGVGSANFSTSAFNPDNFNFENVRIDDSKKLYDLYLERFNYLLKQTVDYIPERCVRKYREKKVVLEVNPDTNLDLLFDQFQERNFQVVITEENMRALKEHLKFLDEEKAKVERAKQMVELICSQKDADVNLKLKKPAQLSAKKADIRNIMTLKKYPSSNQNLEDIRSVLLMDVDYKIYKKFDAQSDDMHIYSTRIENSKIKLTLEKIHAFTQAYYDFALVPDEIFPSKIY